MLKLGGKRSPGIPDNLREVLLDKVKDFVRTAIKSTFYPISTCAIMPQEKGSVVDTPGLGFRAPRDYRLSMLA